eukprot:TRINITY_DN4384_c0_g1_i3.p3 TRINITY_DN4384_c0_g1~~TRINITY_DN4384_c0_g1_i3.p3  ORF type:complete len:204 (+),score=-16.94 TRINITY_DN4384_c0_g1_i3:226-837(+)
MFQVYELAISSLTRIIILRQHLEYKSFQEVLEICSQVQQLILNTTNVLTYIGYFMLIGYHILFFGNVLTEHYSTCMYFEYARYYITSRSYFAFDFQYRLCLFIRLLKIVYQYGKPYWTSNLVWDFCCCLLNLTNAHITIVLCYVRFQKTKYSNYEIISTKMYCGDFMIIVLVDLIHSFNILGFFKFYFYFSFSLSRYVSNFNV